MNEDEMNEDEMNEDEMNEWMNTRLNSIDEVSMGGRVWIRIRMQGMRILESGIIEKNEVRVPGYQYPVRTSTT